MTPYYDDGLVILHVGHVLDVLAGLEAGSVQTCITSPPYWGLRAYGTESQVWGGEPDCAHLWAFGLVRGTSGGTASLKVQIKGEANFQIVPDRVQATCDRCGAWRGELGSEPTPEQYVANIVAVFRAVRRVLRDDGCIWINLGDSYSGSGKGPTGHNGIGDQGQRQGFVDQRSVAPGLKAKDLVGIPWRVAFALQADGWYLRSDIIWHKPNPMPESVTDRPTKSHEYLFLLSKQPVYYFDSEAVREKAEYGRREVTGPPRNGRQAPSSAMWRGVGDSHEDVDRGARTVYGSDPSAGRNIRSVWTIPTESFPGSHFATFPRKLVEPCVLAGSRPEDVVLDPFAGSGTTLAVARWHQRRAVGIELNPEYARLVTERLRQGVLL